MLIDQLSAQGQSIGFAPSLTLLARVTTPTASGAELRTLSGFGCAVGSKNCLRKVEAPPVAAAPCR